MLLRKFVSNMNSNTWLTIFHSDGTILVHAYKIKKNWKLK
jgi:hypothetical protein